jgi:DNA-binding CsgD family transcriptional regulator
MGEGLDRQLPTLGDRSGRAAARAIGAGLARPVTLSLAFVSDEPIEARLALVDEAIGLLRRDGHTWQLAHALNTSGMIARNGGLLHRAMHDFEESAALYGELDDLAVQTYPLGNLALIWLEQRRNLAAARSAFEAAYAASKRNGQEHEVSYSLATLALIAYEEGDLVRALTLNRDCLEMSFELGQLNLVAQAWVGIAQLLEQQRMFDPAARLLGAAENTHRSYHSLDAPVFRRRNEELIARLRFTLGDLQFDKLFAAGAALTFDEAVAEARRDLADLDTVQATPVVNHPISRPQGYPGGFTEREVEVLRLIASGSSSREIAAALIISEGTVERHVTNLYGKIGAHSRAGATAYAFRYQLQQPDEG